MCTFLLQLSLRFSSLSLVFGNLVPMCLGVVFFMFILGVDCSSLDHSLDDFHQIWEFWVILSVCVVLDPTLWDPSPFWSDSLMLLLLLLWFVRV